VTTACMPYDSKLVSNDKCLDGTGIDVLGATVQSVPHRDQFVSLIHEGDLTTLGSHPWPDHSDSGGVIDY